MQLPLSPARMVPMVANPTGTRNYQKLARMVRRRDGNRCQICGSADRPHHVDHTVPRHLGGPVFDMRNMRLLCRTCNLIKGGSLMSDAEVLTARQALGSDPPSRPQGPTAVITRDYSRADG